MSHRSRWHFREQKLLAFLLAFALLICNTAAGLASRLAGGLALAASAVLCAKVLCLDSLDMLHNKPPYINYSHIIAQRRVKVNR